MPRARHHRTRPRQPRGKTLSCETQEEVDTYWSTLPRVASGPCGWLKDKFGLSWQIIPTALPRLLADPDREKSQRVMQAMLQMRKIEIDELERAAAVAAASC